MCVLSICEHLEKALDIESRKSVEMLTEEISNLSTPQFQEFLPKTLETRVEIVKGSLRTTLQVNSLFLGHRCILRDHWFK